MTDRTAAMTGSEPIRTQNVLRAAAWLGGLGLLPFVVGAPLVAYGEASWAYDALRYYAAAIMSFMGGVQWGLAAKDVDPEDESALLWRRLSLSVAPPLIAWLALLLKAPVNLVVIAAAFGLLLLTDLSAVRQWWEPGWHARLHIPLTAIVLIAPLLAVWGMAG